jgi:hypothetical protein
MSCNVVGNMQFATAALAGLAAIFWLITSLVRIPSMDAEKLVRGRLVRDGKPNVRLSTAPATAN